MEPIIIAALIISVFATLSGVFAKTTRQSIHILALQAAVIGLVQLIFCLINLIMGLGFEALVDFFATFAEWFSAAVISPLIIYWGMMKTENVSDEPIVNIQRGGIAVVSIVAANILLCVLSSAFFPEKINVLPFVALMFSLSIFITATRADPLKILVGLNMAENALYPLFAESPLFLIPFILFLMIFVNIVGVFIIVEAYRDYGDISVKKWRWTE
ncbi:MAG: hypothetical protein RMJ15_07365 [Nitrososphaerota archaeon]|nr:hypothetical protein [Candidatus Bathyarchaeota archaeon]MDW8023535.1 hypothetical protein [Nitrososphaerota archaeon]